MPYVECHNHSTVAAKTCKCINVRGSEKQALALHLGSYGRVPLSVYRAYNYAENPSLQYGAV